jgi:DnaJ like chaperone protein
MSWWGTLLGGAVGYMLGGPLGALVGAALGHGMGRGGTPLPSGSSGVERTQTAFFTATFSVMGHMAKSDGRVSEDEIALANRVMERMDLPSTLRDFARRLFAQGKSPDFPLEEVLHQLGRETRSRDLLRMFLEIQVFAAYADGRVHPAERGILGRICERLGFDAATLAQVETLVRAELAGEFSSTGGGPASLEDAYRLLGVSERDDDATVKRAYRRLMSQHHPDKLVAKGLPEEMMKLATAKAQEIKGAYEQVKRARGKA